MTEMTEQEIDEATDHQIAFECYKRNMLEKELMKRTEVKKLYRKAMRTWGYDAQMQMLMEESAELIQAVSKVLRNKKAPNDAYRMLAEEMADVEIMIDQIKEHTTWMNLKSHVETNKHDKLLRLKERLAKYDNLADLNNGKE
jgi:NTP pyrophosphatase (non-canonical NTP hydrolase)